MGRRRSLNIGSSLVLGPWPQVQSTAVWLNITDVHQCEPVTIRSAGSSLRGGAPGNLTLSIIPINDTALIFRLPNASALISGIALNFFPYPSGSYFIASLDDNSTGNVITVSDLMPVLPSSTRNSSSCLQQPNTVKRRFQVTSTLSQCETFTMSYDTTVVFEAPRIRLYHPKGPAITLSLVADDIRSGKASYMLTISRGNAVILLMESGKDIHESTPLLMGMKPYLQPVESVCSPVLVYGDSRSDTSCLKSMPANAVDAKIPEYQYMSSNSYSKRVYVGLFVLLKLLVTAFSRAVIVGSVLGGSALLLIIIFIARFIIRDRRKRRRRHGVIFERGQIAFPPTHAKVDTVARNSLEYEPEESKSRVASTIQSFFGDTYPDLPVEGGETLPTQREPIFTPLPRKPSNLKFLQHSSPVISIEQCDIEAMLNLATIPGGFDSRRSTVSAVGSALPMNSPVEKFSSTPSISLSQ